MKTTATSRRRRAFTLMEVMIAVAILFMGTFAILSLISSTLANARRLQRPLVDATALLSQLSITNVAIEGNYNGDLGELLGKNYQMYKYEGVITEVASNKLFEADFVILDPNGGKNPISTVSTLFYMPQSPAGSLDGGNFVH